VLIKGMSSHAMVLALYTKIFFFCTKKIKPVSTDERSVYTVI